MTTDVPTQNGSNRQQLDLSRPEGLDGFLVSARSVYETLREFEAAARVEQYASVAFPDVTGEELFKTVHELWGEVQLGVRRAHAVVENDGEITEKALQRLQRQYDDLLVIRDYVQNVYEKSPADDVVTKLESTPVRNAVGAVYLEVEQMIAEAKQQVQASKARLLNILSVAKDTSSNASLAEMSELEEKVQTLSSRVTSSRTTVRDVAVLMQAKTQYGDILRAIIAKAKELEDAAKQQIASVATGTTSSTSRVNEVAGLPTEVVAAKAEKEAATVLWQRVVYNPFYTNKERDAVKELYDAVLEGVQSGVSPSVREDRLAVLEGFISGLEKAPQVSELAGRVAQIMRRVTMSLPYDSETLRTARMLERKCREALVDSTKVSAQKIEAYRMLEEYVSSHEAEWLMVCGMPVPEAGEDGRKTARNMREALMLERDRNQAFIQNQRKQVLVDKLIRKLSFIPPEGFAADTDIVEIKNLIRAIDVPGQQVDHPVGSQVATEDAGGFAVPGAQSPKHHDLRVGGDDEAVDLSIRVALKASKRSKRRRKKRAVEKEAATPEAQLVEIVPTKEQAPVVAAMEKKDPVRQAVPTLTPKVFPPAPAAEKRSLSKLYLSDDFYQDFITAQYTSPAAFERMLETIITQIESKTTDVFERWLGEQKASAFEFMEEMTITEVLELAGNKNVRDILGEQNIKYETYLSWVDMIDEMQAVVGEDLGMKFGALYSRWVIESEMIFAREESVSSNSQF